MLISRVASGPARGGGFGPLDHPASYAHSYKHCVEIPSGVLHDLSKLSLCINDVLIYMQPSNVLYFIKRKFASHHLLLIFDGEPPHRHERLAQLHYTEGSEPRQWDHSQSRISTLMRDIGIAILSVCPSVRNVPVSDENSLTYCHSFFTIR